ncbi:hypothetical protein DTL42_23225 [Bremerella cremea]|uniref:AsmA family protein n=1 Tax=Bremerella cremea TaxID=1031537 RepID=A0A368KL47_9BACT|nr:hypothetical protein [Bremerella cremea]RCS41469.1 hypothetical protein DTL42_23225 [Bremerella cremea]
MKLIRKHWGKLLGLAGGCFLLLVILLVAAPTIMAYGPIRDFLLHQLFNGQEVTVAVDSVSVGWFQSTKIEHLQVAQRENKFDVDVAVITNDLSLFQLISQPRQLGNLVIERPAIVLQLPSETSDLFNRGPEAAPSIDEAQLQAALSRTIDVSVFDASVEVRKPGQGEPWGFQKIAFLAQLRPGQTEAEGPSLLVPEATLMEHQQLTQAMCDDLLKFVAPVVTGVTKVDGDVSLSLKEIRVPLADRQNSVGKGTLSIHEVNLTGSPLVQKITDFLGVGASVEVFTDCNIEFELVDRRIYHEGLDFGVGNLRVRTHGFVGLDKSLDLIAEIPIPLAETGELLTGDKPNPLLAALRGKTIQIPIVGTLDNPQIDGQRLGNSLLSTAESTLRDLLQNENLELNLQGDDGQIDVEQIMGLTGALLQGANREGGLLDQMRQRRETPQQGSTDAAKEEAPPQGLLKRFFRRVEKSLKEPPPDGETATPPNVSEDGAIDL